MNQSPVRHRPLVNADKIWHLKRAALVSKLSAQELEVIGQLVTDCIYPKGSTIFRQEDPVEHLFILNRGYVQISLEAGDSRSRVLQILKGGEIFGEEILDPQALHQATATAYEECWVSLLPRREFLQLIRRRPALSLNFIRILTQRLSEARADLQDLGSLNAAGRVAKTLLKLGDVHGTPMFEQEHLYKLKIPVSHRNLADMIGANRPHISSIMSGFKKQGFLNYQGRRLLLNMEELKRQLG